MPRLSLMYCTLEQQGRQLRDRGLLGLQGVGPADSMSRGLAAICISWSTCLPII